MFVNIFIIIINYYFFIIIIYFLFFLFFILFLFFFYFAVGSKRSFGKSGKKASSCHTDSIRRLGYNCYSYTV